MDSEKKRIVIYLTNKCNLNCKHCFLMASPDKNSKLNLKQVKSILEYYAKKKITQVSFTGGEAIFFPHIKTVVNYARKLKYKQITLNTNGTIPSIFDMFTPKQIDQLAISLDGLTAETHEAIRGKGTFNKTINFIKKSIKLGYKTSIIITINKYNYKEIVKMIYFLDNLGVQKISFNYLSLRGNAKKNPSVAITPNQYSKIYQRVILIDDLKNAKLRISKLFITPQELSQTKKNSLNCLLRLGQPKIEVLPSGEIFHCCLLSDFSHLSSGLVKKNGEIESKIIGFETPNQNSLQIACPAHNLISSQKIENGKKLLIPTCLYYKDIISGRSN